MYNEQELVEAAERLALNVRGFETRTLKKIGENIKAVGRLSSTDEKALQNMLKIGTDLDEIYADLARTTGRNIKEIQEIMTGVMTDEVKASQVLYQATGTPFLPYAENPFAQHLVANWIEQTAGEMINLSRTKAIGFVNADGEFTSLQGAYQKAMDEAVVAVRTGVADFNSAMTDTIERLGGIGISTYYGGGVHRSLESMVRQNLLYGAKQAAQSYQDHVGEEIGADGFAVDAHAGCRPSHEFMQGQMFSLDGKVTIDGVTYEDGSAALDAMQDYGCLHFRTPVLLGISQPRYSKEELAEIERETKEPIEYDGQSKTLYEWKQKQREIERNVRSEKSQAVMAKSAGNNTLAKEHSDRADALTAKYNDMCKGAGLQATPERMAIVDKI